MHVLATKDYEKWYSELTNKQKAQVMKRLNIIKTCGHLREVNFLGGKLYELKWKNGWRVYFIRIQNIIILLNGDIKMSKKKTSKKREVTWNDIEEAEVNLNKIKTLKEIRPEEFFKDRAKVGAALFECLIANDTGTFIEILDEYLKVNRSYVAKQANLGRSTVQEVFSKKGNPTLKTIAKIVHFSADAAAPKNQFKR